MIGFLYVLAGVFGAAFLHPYVFYPLSLRMMRARPVDRGQASRPVASLLFAAYNEERALPSKLANIEAIKRLHPDLEVLAYCDLCTDRSLSLLQSRRDLLRVIAATERTGKATGMRRMVEEARGDVCIFTDANVLIEPGSVGKLLDHFRNPDVGGVAGTLHYVNEEESVTAGVSGLYWRLEERIKALESRCGSIMGADGSIFATRRNLYPEVPPHLLDDMTASFAVLFHGQRLISAPDVVAYERNASAASDEFRRKRRIACRAFNTHRYLRKKVKRHLPPVDRYKYVSHKLLRWFGAPLALLSALSLAAALLLDGRVSLLILIAAGAGTALAAGLLKLRPFSSAFAIAGAIVATFFGVMDALRGRTYQTWTPAQSRD